VSRCHKGKTNLDFTKARDSEWQLHQLDHMQVCTSPVIDNHASPRTFSLDALPATQPTVEALKEFHIDIYTSVLYHLTSCGVAALVTGQAV